MSSKSERKVIKHLKPQLLEPLDFNVLYKCHLFVTDSISQMTSPYLMCSTCIVTWKKLNTCGAQLHVVVLRLSRILSLSFEMIKVYTKQCQSFWFWGYFHISHYILQRNTVGLYCSVGAFIFLNQSECKWKSDKEWPLLAVGLKQMKVELLPYDIFEICK